MGVKMVNHWSEEKEVIDYWRKLAQEVMIWLKKEGSVLQIYQVEENGKLEKLDTELALLDIFYCYEQIIREDATNGLLPAGLTEEVEE